uniref:uncharacterized protein LOC108588643 n=1 Tax=Callithrix jacchus TaxID=9483 RepID=UPI0023DD31FA|nr:uncharacterized protein LOC108588643 [Callithrix jacchus]
MDAEKEAAACVEGSGRIRKGRVIGTSRGASRSSPPRRSRTSRAAPVGPPLLLARRSRPGRPSLVPPALAAVSKPSLRCLPGTEGRGGGGSQRPGESRAALATMGISTLRGRRLASITANLPWPPCWEETTRHAAAKRLQRRKRRRRRRRRRCLPRAAAAPGGWGRRAVREERPEPQRYGGPAGPPAFACREVCGVTGVLWRRAQHFGLLTAAGLRDQGSPPLGTPAPAE